ncbi:DUF3221 domain-containing protein [Halobacillus sp. A5]|uniref:DUF3221 domain-containing protein n=1 Tax=Halobacillus sp. A5 TaxID=2880263 RepID=UPI0020A6D7E1|nr:DUF3221 domain-containing protein [Halobacillus sp. A5]MCP3027311.1 YobA family protein [Halobacillus sp. A5]
MKKWLLLIFIVLSACGTTDEEEEDGSTGDSSNDQEGKNSTYSGYVMDQNETSILVVDTIEPDGGEPIWVTGVKDDMWLGKKVEVTIDGAVAESTPMQGEAAEVNVVEPEQPEGADLTESQALASALSEVDRGNALSIESLSYEEQKDEWVFKLRSTVTESGTEKVIVPDKNFEEG